MSKLRCILALVVLLVAVFGSVGWAKVTLDPNAPGAQTKAASDDADPRLAQKITYDSGYKRLHVVVDDIARLSRVSIACGSSTKDWRVRDIPVVVCVKDMPLGKLLHAIAAATHTWIASPKTGDKTSVKGYRVYRRAKEEAEIDSLLQNRHEAKMAQVSWQWDAMMAYGKSPEITEFLHNDAEWAAIHKPLWPVAKLMATLGPDAKDKMLAGETFRFRGSDAASKEVVNGLYQIAWDNMKDHMGETGKTAPPPTRQDAEATELTIKLTDTGDSGETEIQVNVSPMIFGRAQSAWTTTLSWAQDLFGTSLKLHSYPEDTKTPSLKDDMGDPAMVPASKSRRSSLNYPLLKAKINVEKPKDLKDPTFADTIRALSKASGCNIVVEDFLSHMAYRYQQMDHSFAKDTSIADFLQWPISGGVLDYAWFFNEGDKLLVGWCDDRGDRAWRDHHRNLLSEEYLRGLKSKLDGPGVAFEDAVQLMTMPSTSFHEWIGYSKDLACLNQAGGFGDDVAWWKLYESLRPEDKVAAKSTDGLALGKLDPQWIVASSRAQKLMTSAYVGGPAQTDEHKQQDDAERKLKDRVTSDPKIIATMVMRIKSLPGHGRVVTLIRGGQEVMGFDNIPSGLKLSSYEMDIDYKIDGKGGKMVIRGPNIPLPVWSAEREAEIIKAATDNAKK